MMCGGASASAGLSTSRSARSALALFSCALPHGVPSKYAPTSTLYLPLYGVTFSESQETVHAFDPELWLHAKLWLKTGSPLFAVLAPDGSSARMYSATLCVFWKFPGTTWKRSVRVPQMRSPDFGMQFCGAGVGAGVAGGVATGGCVGVDVGSALDVGVGVGTLLLLQSSSTTWVAPPDG